jgi:mannose-6-phosphate isomerase-like protein (cupin superfamily)
MNEPSQTSTDATRGQDLRLRVEARKRELESAVERLPADDRSRQNLESVLSQVQGLLTGDLDNFPRVVAAELNTWLEASKHLDEYHRRANGGNGAKGAKAKGAKEAKATDDDGDASPTIPRAGFVTDIRGAVTENEDLHHVLYTAPHCQLAVMSLKPLEEIGAETHDVDQVFRIEGGSGVALVDGIRTPIRAGFVVVVPAGTPHNIVNTGSSPLRLLTLYAPPQHRDDVFHPTRADVEKDTEPEPDGSETSSPPRGAAS